jgi:hypothetical protein
MVVAEVYLSGAVRGEKMHCVARNSPLFGVDGDFPGEQISRPPVAIAMVLA